MKRLQFDIYADIMYPNDKRPPENHGYHKNINDNQEKDWMVLIEKIISRE